MPGYIIHLAAARLVVDKLGFSDFEEKLSFYVGSVLADTMPRASKKESHFWSDESLRLLKRAPELDVFCEKYSDNMAEPVVEAYRAHLFMDRIFVNDYWTRHFEFYNDNMEPETGYDLVTNVKLVDTGEIIPRERFLSDEYYYGDYTRLLPYIIGKYALKDIFEGHNQDYIKRCLDMIDCSAIEEIKGDDYKAYIMRMFDSIYECTEAGTPKLRVFDLKEMEKLIEDTVNYCLL